jgi:hypothetical protein
MVQDDCCFGDTMYSPHQYPWTITETLRLLKTVTEKSGRSFYFTEDLGHHHIKYIKPGKDVFKAIEKGKALPRNVWLGSDRAFQIGLL